MKDDNTVRTKTILDIARALGLSKSTVSRALNGNPVISEETRRLVAATAKDLRYSKNVAAQRLTTRASRTIAFITHENGSGCESGDWFGLELLGGLTQGLQTLGYTTLVKPIDYRDYSWVRSLLDSRQVDGFVLMTSSRKNSHIRALLEAGAPFVTWGAAQPGVKYPSVCGDDRAGGRLAGEHLAKYGRVDVLAGPEEELEVQRRLEGFVEGLQEAGGTLGAVVFAPEFGEESGEAGMRTLLASRPRAVFCHSDLLAVGAIRVIRAQGLEVPRDVAVVGYDGLLMSSYLSPPLTTVSQHLPQVGRALGQGLVTYLERGEVTHLTLPVELLVRGSS